MPITSRVRARPKAVGLVLAKPNKEVRGLKRALALYSITPSLPCTLVHGKNLYLYKEIIMSRDFDDVICRHTDPHADY